MSDRILTLNAGSSSLKFAVYALTGRWPARVAHGCVEEIGAASRFQAEADGHAAGGAVTAKDHASAVAVILNWFDATFPEAHVAAIGHRVVHGGLEFVAPTLVDHNVLDELRALAPLAPLHQPHNIAGLEAARLAFPHVPQIACFDTAFHRGHSFVNEAYALPRAYYERGVRRFGFHGLSYEFIAHRMREIDPVVACGRVIVAHLGAGASLCAMKDGRSVASTMGFTALEGLPMATRSGAIDPGLILYLLEQEKMSVEDLSDLLYQQSGLKGLSGLSGDMRVLEASKTAEATDAINYFAHRVRMQIGALTATMNGLDALVFTAGIGEHSVRARREICSGMEWLGIALNELANAKGALRISKKDALTPVFVVPTDEESMIARHTVAAAGVAQIVAAA